MILTTVLGSVNNNPNYYMFIPKQIIFWKHFNIKFIAIFVGESLPDILLPYSDNIILYTKNLDLNSAYVAQNIRIYYPALLTLSGNEMVMITDMDMLPTNIGYYTRDIEKYSKDDFIYYRNVDGNQIYMCYNAANPTTWSKIFNINSVDDIEKSIYENYNNIYDGIPGSTGWFIDQELMYKKLINYEKLIVLNRPIRRLEIQDYKHHLKNNRIEFISEYDDVHFHRNYFTNESLIENAELQLKNKQAIVPKLNTNKLKLIQGKFRLV